MIEKIFTRNIYFLIEFSFYCLVCNFQYKLWNNPDSIKLTIIKPTAHQRTKAMELKLHLTNLSSNFGSSWKTTSVSTYEQSICRSRTLWMQGASLILLPKSNIARSLLSPQMTPLRPHVTPMTWFDPPTSNEELLC